MAPTELQPAADGTERFALGLAGFERTAILLHLGTCPVRADQAPRKLDEKPAIKVISVDGPFSRLNVRGRQGRVPDRRAALLAHSPCSAPAQQLSIPPLPTSPAGRPGGPGLQP